jgi:anti-anti-sigma regulatory factor
MANPALFQKEAQGESTLITILGEIDATSILKGLFDAPTRRIAVDLSGVRRINSCGIREWMKAVEAIPPGIEVEFIRCSRPMVKQFNQVANFGGPGRVVSFYAPYYCQACDLEENVLLSVPQHVDDLVSCHAPEFRCENCGGLLAFDDLEERYFSFVARQETTVQK